MKSIYLDHNIVRYFVKGFPSSFDATAENAALEHVLARDVEARFVVSDWNVVEAARHCVGAPTPIDLAAKYSSFFEQLTPLYTDTHNAVERSEMRRLAFAHWGYASSTSAVESRFATHFSQVASSRIKDILVGFSLRINLRHLVITPRSLAQFDAPIEKSKAVLNAAIAARNDGLLKSRELQRDVDQEWFFSLMPERDANGKWIAVSERRQLAATFAADPTFVLEQCPAMYVETCVSDLREATGGRIARDGDVFDLMHVIPALAYCDAFVSNDGPLFAQAEKVCRKVGRRMVLERSLSDAVEKLGI